MKEGVVLLGHGSRREEANEEIHELGRQVEEGMNGFLYEVAFLSFGKPDLSTAVEKLVREGLERIIIVPVFLVTGNHINRDIPDKILQEKEKYPHVNFVTAGHLGADPIVAGLVSERIKDVERLS